MIKENPSNICQWQITTLCPFCDRPTDFEGVTDHIGYINVQSYCPHCEKPLLIHRVSTDGIESATADQALFITKQIDEDMAKHLKEHRCFSWLTVEGCNDYERMEQIYSQWKDHYNKVVQ